MINKIIFLIFLFSVLFACNLSAQKCRLTGKILDKNTHEPIAYANIALYNIKDSALVTGTMTHDDGIFILENLPSVQLDLEGTLTYRGEGTFKVYINGHPVANGEEKLRQLPASRIDKIEVITNPSAKYDAEGTAGIIQVILKKNRLEGYSINSSLKVDTRGGYRGLFAVDNKSEKFGWYVNTVFYECLLE